MVLSAYSYKINNAAVLDFLFRTAIFLCKVYIEDLSFCTIITIF